MGVCCSSSGGNASNGAASIAGKSKPKKSEKAEASIGSRAAVAATAAVGATEDTKARARRRALQALVESLQNGESVIPSSKWRGQYLKTNAIGPAVISTIVAYIQSKSKGAAAKAAAITEAASETKSPRSKHNIRTLDLRALRTGDDGFVEMMMALLDDTIVENVIFAGNEITDDGVRRLIKQIESRNGPTVAATSSQTLAGSSGKVVLPSQLKFIGLTDNLITPCCIAELASIAPLFRTLEQLEVGRGQSGGGEDIDEVCDTLSLHDVTTISAYIQHTHSLATFLYKGTGNYHARSGFSPDGFALFVDNVVGHSALQELYLQDCFNTKPALIGPVTVQAPGRKGAGAAATPPITEEPDESWSLEHIHEAVQTLSNSLCLPSSQLSTLVLRFPLSDDAVHILAKGIGRAPHLANLSLRGCDMSGKALGYIGDALTTNRALRMLDVSYQANAIAHPVYLVEMRHSSKRRYSYTGGSITAYSAAEIVRQELSSGSSEVPSREERQHPLLHIIRSLHQNRSLAQLIMLGVNISTEDIEELCACIESSGNKTLSEVWYTTAGNEALKMKLEDFLAANREFGGVGNGGVGPSAVSSVRSSTMRINGSCANFFPDSTSPSDPSESFSRGQADRMSTTRNTNDSIPYRSPPAPLPIPHHPPRSSSLHGVMSVSDNTKVERCASPSLSSTTLNLKAGTGKATANGDSSSVQSMVLPSQVAISVDDGIPKSAISLRSRTLRVTGRDASAAGPPSTDQTEDARTIPYTSKVASTRKARPT